MSTQSYNTQSYAESYAIRGWRVYPVYGILGDFCGCGRLIAQEDCSAGKHPDGTQVHKGFKDATTDLARIRTLDWGNRNVGIRTGYGLLVIDYDPRAVTDLKAALDFIASLPETYTVVTGRGDGGMHFYFLVAPSLSPIIPPPHVPAGFSYQHEGAAVIAPPSRHASGGTYTVLKDIPLAQLPEDLIHFRAEKETDKEPAGLIVPSRSIGEWVRTSRNWLRRKYGSDCLLKGSRRIDTLKKLSGYLRGSGLTGMEVQNVIKAVNRECCQPPLPPSKFKGWAQWVDRYLEVGQFKAAFPTVSNPRNLLDQIVEVARQCEWTGKQGHTDRLVLEALLYEGFRQKSDRFPTSERSLSLNTAIEHRNTIRSSLHRLEASGFCELLPSPDDGDSGTTIRLTLPAYRDRPSTSPTSIQAYTGPNIPAYTNSPEYSASYIRQSPKYKYTLVGECMIFGTFQRLLTSNFWRAFGDIPLRIYLTLMECGVMLESELMTIFRLSKSTTNRILNNLKQSGLARKTRKGWKARKSGVRLKYTKQEELEKRYQAERESFQKMLESRSKCRDTPHKEVA